MVLKNHFFRKIFGESEDTPLNNHKHYVPASHSARFWGSWTTHERNVGDTKDSLPHTHNIIIPTAGRFSIGVTKTCSWFHFHFCLCKTNRSPGLWILKNINWICPMHVSHEPNTWHGTILSSFVGEISVGANRPCKDEYRRLLARSVVVVPIVSALHAACGRPQAFGSSSNWPRSVP